MSEEIELSVPEVYPTGTIEEPAKPSEKRKKIVLIVLLLTLTAGGLILFLDPETFTLLGGNESGSTEIPGEGSTAGTDAPAEKPPEPAAAATLPPATMPESPRTPPTSVQEKAEMKFPTGPQSDDMTHEALELIAEWKDTGKYEAETLKSYLSHRKAWVKLAAIEFALIVSFSDKGALRVIGDELVSEEGEAKIRRFMKRYASSKVYAEMNQSLGI